MFDCLKLKNLSLKVLIRNGDKVKNFEVLKLDNQKDLIKLNFFIEFKATFAIQLCV